MIFAGVDCLADADFIEAYRSFFASEFASDLSLGFAGGRILLYDHRGLRKTIKESTEVEVVVAHCFVPVGFIQGANFAVRKDVLKAINGFDHR
ncbi:MAG: hypothetical protein Cons2KO_30110 [Congregibacter sp.]